MTMTITCKTCNDTGWDDLFNSACGDCGAHLADIDVEAARAAFAESRVKEDSLAAKRVALVEWLETQDWDFPLSLARQFKSKGDLSIKQWAAAERLHAKATDPAAPPRWAKVGDVWGVRVVGGSTGDTVTVTTKAGKTSEVVLGEALGDDVFAPGKSAAAKAAEKVVTGPGFYVTADDTVVKVQEARTTGNLYGKALGDNGKFEYAPGIMAKLVRRLTLEEAAAYGRRTGKCMICSRTLTVQASIDAGIGPVCASRL